MPTWSTILLFFATTAVLVATPGPVVMYIIACSLDQGRQAGLISALGVGVGTLFHVIASTLGISAILISSPFAFAVVKYAGAIYLIYLGIQAFITRETRQQRKVSTSQSLTKMFVQGALINILNPKTALFAFAFLPRFIDSSRGSVVWQMLLFGCLLVVLGFCNDSLYVILAGTTSKWLSKNTQFLKIQRYVSGCIYILLGATTALVKIR